MTDEELKIQAMIRFWKDLNSSEQQLKMCEGCQIRWERDKAMEQLAEHHIPFMCVAEDVVQVVRCKDCTYWDEAKVNSKGFLICPASGMEIFEIDYCSYGERREDGNK